MNNTKDNENILQNISTEGAVRVYCDKGYKIVPAHEQKKRPVMKKWPKVATSDLGEVYGNEWFLRNENIAIITGKASNLVIIDIDVENGESVDDLLLAAEEKVCPLPDTYTVLSGNNGMHLYYNYPEIDKYEIRNDTRILDLPIDIRAEGGCIIAPPSRYPDSIGMYYVACDDPVVDLPQEWIDFLKKKKNNKSKRKTISKNKKNKEKKTELMNNEIPDGKWKEGIRNNTLFLFLIRELKNGLIDSDLKVYANLINTCRCEPPLPEDEVDSIVESVLSYRLENDPNVLDLRKPYIVPEEMIEELYKDFICIYGNGRASILNVKDMVFYTVGNAIEAFNHKLIVYKDGEKTMTMNSMRFWYNKTKRRFSKPVFRPDGDIEKDEFNLWRGYAVNPDPNGNISLFEEHINNNIGGRDKRFSDFLYDWMAQMIQEPQNRIGKVPVLVGSQGCGKSIIGNILSGLFHKENFLNFSSMEEITHQFNPQLLTASLILADESTWGGQKRDVGKLKGFITQNRMSIEAKGVNPIQADVFFRVMLTSNESWAAPVEKGDRRYVTLPVADNNRNDRDFFTKMMNQMENEGGYGRLLYELQNRDISNVDWNIELVTDEHLEMLIRGFSNVEAWLYESLSLIDREENIDEPNYKNIDDCLYFLNQNDIDRKVVKKSDVYSRFKEWTSHKRGRDYVPTSAIFGKTLNKIFNIEAKRLCENKARVTAYQFQSVELLKKDFAKYLDVPVEKLFVEEEDDDIVQLYD